MSWETLTEKLNGSIHVGSRSVDEKLCEHDHDISLSKNNEKEFWGNTA